MATLRNRAGERVRDTVRREGKWTLVILAILVVVGFGFRLDRVVHPLGSPGDDALAYRELAATLYTDQSYGGPDFTSASDWSPGAPLMYAAAYYATGGVRDGVGRGVEAILGTGAIIIAFLLTRRLATPAAGLVAAAGVTFYPSFIHTTGALLSEPPATFTLPAAVLAFLWADEQDSPVAWALPGLLFGLTALIRPEYLVVGVAFAIFALVRRLRASANVGWRAPLAVTGIFFAAFLAPLIPWTIHNYVVLDRFVPLSTGGGKALYVGSNLPADGDYQRTKALLVKQYLGRDLEPNSPALDRINPVPLFNRVADRYSGLDRDAALGKIGKKQLRDDIEHHTFDYIGMTARKAGRLWSTGVGPVMATTAGRVLQYLLLALGIAGFAWLCMRRRWEAIAFAIPIVGITGIGALSLASNRRNEILMTLVIPLAAIAATRLAAAMRQAVRP